MIVTLTLNPAVDKTIMINDFKINNVNRVASSRLDAGGKGINVSKTIKALGGESVAIGALAGSTGYFIQDNLNLSKIENDFVCTKGETRTNIKIVDAVNGTNTDINERGAEISDSELHKISEKVRVRLSSNDFLVLSGSVPVNVDKNIYKDIITMAKRNGAKTILDADGDLLKNALSAAPFMIKPNIHELEELFSVKICSIEEILTLTKNILSLGVEIIVVSLGAKGALLITNDIALYAEALPVKPISTVGAGDSMVAAFAYAFHNKSSLEDAFRLAVATAAASIMTPGTSPGKPEVIKELFEKVKVKKL